MRLRSLGPALAAAVLLITIAVACGSEDGSLFGSSSGDDGDGGGGGGTSGNSFGGPTPGEAGGAATITALTIDPPTATLDLTTSPYPTQAFTATATYANGTKGPANVGWTASNTPVGTIDRNGLYTPRGALGGVVTITATTPGASATATLTVRLHQGNASTVDEATRTGLLGATTADASVVWTYPYDNTAFPRGLHAPELMWNNGADGDEYLIHLESGSGTYELQAFTPASTVTAIAGTTPAGARKFQFDPSVWTSFVESTSGAATLTVTRKSGSAFTKLVSQSWSIASRSMSGTIYYWAINKGQVVRIKPGATAPDAFLGPWPPLPNKGQPSLYCPSCHTASADGSRMALSTGPQPSCDPGGADVWSTLLDLGKSQPIFNGYETNNPPSQLTLAGLSADGKVAVENWALVRGCNPPPANTDSLVALPQASTTDTTLTHITDSGLEGLVGSGHHTYFPVFSPDNKLFVYVDSESGALYALDWDPAGQKFGNRQELAPAGGTKIAYPTISPDHRWVVYQRGPDWGSLDTSFTGDLYAVDTLNPMHEIPLDAVNSSFSAAAGGARDQHRSYEPTFAPVSSGGFFWLVFHTRRTYGNQLVDVPYVNGTEGSGTKQLWVAAIGVPGAGAATSDPSRPPFWLPGQDATTRNMRGYWVLDPCKADGASCVSGTDCCNGFCDTVDDAGAPICGKSSATCSQSGDRCNENRDCCTLGDTCINHACSESQPK